MIKEYKCSFCGEYTDFRENNNGEFICNHCDIILSSLEYHGLTARYRYDGCVMCGGKMVYSQGFDSATCEICNATRSNRVEVLTAKIKAIGGNNMKTILVKFREGETIYTYNTKEDVKVGDIINVDYLSSSCKVVDAIEESRYKYICKKTGDLKEIRSNVNDILIKELKTERTEVITKHFMAENK